MKSNTCSAGDSCCGLSCNRPVRGHLVEKAVTPLQLKVTALPEALHRLQHLQLLEPYPDLVEASVTRSDAVCRSICTENSVV